jgi:outer membrane lipopolysaccharide assembly protein LptE/RlpB
MMKKTTGLLAIAATALLTACTYQENNTIDQKDVNAGNDYVYAHPDSMARQRKVQYPVNSENEVRAMEIQEKLYGSTGLNGSNVVKE